MQMFSIVSGRGAPCKSVQVPSLHLTLEYLADDQIYSSYVFGSTRSIFISREVSSAEREIGERETNRSIVHNISTIGNRT
jgi:hypothetical protein